MRVTLTVIDGPLAGRRIWIMGGQMAEVGRNANVDFSVPHDAGMADIHFALETDAATCRVRDMSGAGVLVNGEPATAAVLSTGDKISAGTTSFLIEVTGLAPAAGATEAVSPAPGATKQTASGGGFAKVGEALAHEIVARVELDEEAVAVLRENLTPRQYVEVLLGEGFFEDAIRFLSHAMPKRDAIWWSHQGAREQLGDEPVATDSAALDAVETWLKESTDESRRAAMETAEKTNFETAAGLTAMAVFFSGGSIAPPEFEPVEPKEQLTAQTVANALIFAGIQDDPAETTASRRKLVELGIAIADGQHPIPDA